jgi:L-ascorbate metabolism protein UlaG (beta-lactamase superfamily)
MKTGKDLISEINQSVIEKESLAFWWLGQLGLAVKLGKTVIYLDPFLSDYPGRRIPGLLQPEEIINADYIFGSHDHIDHIDREAWQKIADNSAKVKFVVPNALKHQLSEELGIPAERFIGISDMKTFEETGIKITGVACAHEFLDQDPETGEYPYMGYFIESAGIRFYHTGDTCIYEGMMTKLLSLGNIDIIMLPINGRDGKRLRANIIGNMTWQEAVDLVGQLKPQLAVPLHYEMFENNLGDPNLFLDYLDIKYPGIDCWIGKHGEKTIYSKK